MAEEEETEQSKGIKEGEVVGVPVTAVDDDRHAGRGRQDLGTDGPGCQARGSARQGGQARHADRADAGDRRRRAHTTRPRRVRPRGSTEGRRRGLGARSTGQALSLGRHTPPPRRSADLPVQTGLTAHRARLGDTRARAARGGAALDARAVARSGGGGNGGGAVTTPTPCTRPAPRRSPARRRSTWPTSRRRSSVVPRTGGLFADFAKGAHGVKVTIARPALDSTGGTTSSTAAGRSRTRTTSGSRPCCGWRSSRRRPRRPSALVWTAASYRDAAVDCGRTYLYMDMSPNTGALRSRSSPSGAGGAAAAYLRFTRQPQDRGHRRRQQRRRRREHRPQPSGRTSTGSSGASTVTPGRCRCGSTPGTRQTCWRRSRPRSSTSAT